MKELLKDEFEDYIKSFDEKRVFGLRANTLKISPNELRDKLKYKLENVPWCKEGFYYSEDERPAKSPYYHAGLYYIQEPSAMSVGAMLDIKPGDKVLDLCAAPGGKSTQVAAKLQNKGIIISNDISASRCKALIKNIELAGVTNAIVTNETPERLSKRFKCFFDKIIVDAPCSGEGMFRKDLDAVKTWTIDKSKIYCKIQLDILKNAAEMLSAGGIIAYSTCTFAPEENENTIKNFVDSNSDFEIINVEKSTGFDCGRYEWVDNGSEDLKKCGRLWPYKIKGEGHFLALLLKKGQKKDIYFDKIKEVYNKDLKYFFDFMDKYTNIKINDNIAVYGSSVLKVPLGIDLKGINVMRSGLYVGDIKTKRFEPSQAFAMALKKEDVKYVINFDIDDNNLIRYLKGESFVIDNLNEGWNIVCVEGYPLGWGKVQNGRLKNKYLPSWKM